MENFVDVIYKTYAIDEILAIASCLSPYFISTPFILLAFCCEYNAAKIID